MRTSTIALALIAAIPLGLIASAPVMWIDANAPATGYRTPSDPAAFWIWPTLEEARRWEAEHTERLCVRQVPDGWATERCGASPVNANKGL